MSRLDYCNAILAGLPRSTIAPLQRAQNAAARVIAVARLSPRDHVTSTLREFQWLPVPYRITYKLCLLMHLIHTGQAPSYLTDIVTQTATVSSSSRLRSTSSLRYEQPRTRLKLGQRAFSYAAPAAWNTLFQRRCSNFLTQKLLNVTWKLFCFAKLFNFRFLVL